MKNKKILITDDEAGLRDSLADFLDDYDAITQTASNGNECLRMIKQFHPDILILDLRMPEMNGFEVLKELSEDLENFPVIVISGTGEIEDVIHAIQLGAWDFISKPVENLEIIYHTLKRALSKSELIQQNEQYRKNLENMIEQRTVQLFREKEKAEKANEYKELLIKNLSHELRTPLSGLLGSMELFDYQNLNLQEQKLFKIMKKSANQLSNLINNLLEINIIETSDLSIEICSFSLNTFFSDLQTSYEMESKELMKSIQFHLQIPENKVIIISDLPKLQKIMQNLLHNAVKFTDTGKISFGFEERKDKVIIHVKDTGKGIQKEKLTSLLESFQNRRGIYLDQPSGIGIGLTIANRYTNILGGELTASSELGKGSIFTFSIPKNLKIYLALKKEQEKNKILNNDNTVLIVEDDDISYLIVKSLLNQYNCPVFHCKTGKEALKILEENDQIDLIIMDYILPGLNGCEITRIIRELYPDIPVILQTSSKPEELEKSCMVKLWDGYLQKPYGIKDFAESVLAIMGNFRKGN